MHIRSFLAASLAVCLFLFAPFAAFAQEVASVVVTEPTFLSELMVSLVPIIGLVITTLIGIGLTLLKQKTGIDVEAQHREALQSALLNGVLFALQKAGWMPGQTITPNIMGMARGYVAESVPDALKQFGINVATSEGKAMLDRLLTPKLPVPEGTVMPNGDTLIGRAPR